MTYPTISHLIENLTGLVIALPIQTFGLFIVLAFVVGNYFIKKGFIKMENLKILHPVKISNQKTKIGACFEYFIKV